MQKTALTGSVTPTHEHCAVFLDYENILYHIKQEYQDPPQLSDVVASILRSLRQHLAEKLGLDVIVFNAYADFERQPSALGSLYLLGVDTFNVLGTEHKNAADMRLCIDLMEVLYTRNDINHFVLVAGDRDYIPVVQHLRRKGRKVKAVAFRATLSGDLLQILGEDNLLEANTFIDETIRRDLLQHRLNKAGEMNIKIVGKIDLPEAPAKKDVAKTAATQAIKRETPAPAAPAAPFQEIRRVTNADACECLELLLGFAHEKNVQEVWLAPFLRYLTDRMPLLADYERKELISNLRACGAIAVEKRSGDTYDFSVIRMNYDHPDVIELMP